MFMCHNNTPSLDEKKDLGLALQKRELLPDMHRDLLPLEEALSICLSEVKEPLLPESLPLMASLDRILQEDIVSDYFVPPFNKSMMDGYAVKFDDVKHASQEQPVRLKVIGDAPAGFFGSHIIQRGESVRIMTGAPVPEGADTVIALEDTLPVGERHVDIQGYFRDNRFIIEKGKDICPGEVVINKGVKITPAVMGMIANCGYAHLKVAKKPRIAILSTGSELVSPGERLEKGQIFDINGYSLYGYAKAFGADVSYLGIAKDTCEDVMRFIQSCHQWDILILSGGVSVGDYDVVHEAFQKIGVQEIFWRVKIKPGKPLFFGKKESSLIFGLPGNPVSALTNFLLFILPVMDKMTGKNGYGLKKGYARVLNDFLLKPGRRKILRGKFSMNEGEDGVFILSEQKSGIFRPLVESDVLIEIHDDVKYVRTGEMVKIYYLCNGIVAP